MWFYNKTPPKTLFYGFKAPNFNSEDVDPERTVHPKKVNQRAPKKHIIKN